MNKIAGFLSVVLLELCIIVNVYAVDRLGGDNLIMDATAIAGTTTVYSKSQDIGSCGGNFGLWIQATSATGTPNLTIQYEQSYLRPSTEGSADTNYVIPDNAPDVLTSSTSELVYIDSLSPVPQKYIRFKITGNAGNANDTILTLRLFVQES